MSFRYWWKTLSEKGHIAEPIAQGARPWNELNMGMGFDTEEEAVAAYKEWYETHGHHAPRALTLVKVYRIES
jgi:hypothetical protein